ncbi:antimicrobial peptide 1b [Beta vulgaris subsp. vulgaris]|uniref:antimicrobial peptide 1b n=1 Tax=Beta vulgaris subsp. vulgaris TaxID=3555 RepID=UPI0020366C58|nr:antimicrobial peptide 1b [Beta vulgaris subsp. vulgaris]
MMKLRSCVIVMVIMAMMMVEISMAFQCGRQAGGARCPGGLCCSQYGYCGTTSQYCGRGQCQGQCRLVAPDEQVQVHPSTTNDNPQNGKDVPDAQVGGAKVGAP